MARTNNKTASLGPLLFILNTIYEVRITKVETLLSWSLTSNFMIKNSVGKAWSTSAQVSNFYVPHSAAFEFGHTTLMVASTLRSSENVSFHGFFFNKHA